MDELVNLLKQASERWPEYFYHLPHGRSIFYEVEIDGSDERMGFVDGYVINPSRPSGVALAVLFEACVRLAIGFELGIQLDKDSLQPKLTRVRLCLGPHSWVGTANESEHHSYSALRALLSLPEEFSRRG